MKQDLELEVFSDSVLANGHLQGRSPDGLVASLAVLLLAFLRDEGISVGFKNEASRLALQQAIAGDEPDPSWNYLFNPDQPDD